MNTRIALTVAALTWLASPGSVLAQENWKGAPQQAEPRPFGRKGQSMGSFSVGYTSSSQRVDYSSVGGAKRFWFGLSYHRFMVDSFAIGAGASYSGGTTSFLSGAETRSSDKAVRGTASYSSAIAERWHLLPTLQVGLRFDDISFSVPTTEAGTRHYFTVGVSVPLLPAPSAGYLLGPRPGLACACQLGLWTYLFAFAH